MSWKNFTLEEFACKHTGENKIEHELIDKLQALRTECGFPFKITSGYRSADHPVERKKSKPGTHALGLAADIGVSCLLYTSPSPRDRTRSRMPSSA